jgi:hypothetical protein
MAIFIDDYFPKPELAVRSRNKGKRTISCHLSSSDIVLIGSYLCGHGENSARIQFGNTKHYPYYFGNSLHLRPDAIDENEFSRSEWFWRGRPKVLSDSLTSSFRNLCRQMAEFDNFERHCYISLYDTA